MALNITINGYCYLDNNDLADTSVRYQLLWYPNGTASSAATWNSVRTCESNGYWSANLGDSDWLGQEGVALDNGKVVAVFWLGTTSDRNAGCSNLSQWAATEITMVGESVYTLDTQIRSNIAPNLVWSLPNSGLTNTYYTATNTSYDVHYWDFGSTVMSHWKTRYGENIQLVNTVSSTSYDWGDNTSTNLTGVASDTHSWSDTGTYSVSAYIYDECGAVTSGTKIITIYNQAPEPAITCHQAVGGVVDYPNTIVTFEYTGTDEDNRITSIDWAIVDTGDFGNTPTITTAGRDAIVAHSSGLGTSWYGQSNVLGAFTNPGTHNISIDVHWNDGFNDQVTSYSVDIEQELFTGPSLAFTQIPDQATVGSGVQFVNNTTNYDRVGAYVPTGQQYYWAYDDSGDITIADDVGLDYVFEYVPKTDIGIVTLTAFWNDGWTNHTSYVSKDTVFGTTVTIDTVECYYLLSITGTSSDGTVTGYSWEVYKEVGSSWELTWESPRGTDQQDKTVCFTSLGLYKIIGYVHGQGADTSDYVYQEIDLVCPTEAYYYIWNGTGAEDVGGDWLHSGVGVETVTAAKSGTNGLDVTNMADGQSFSFARVGPPISIYEYDLLSLQINLVSWKADADLLLKFKSLGDDNGSSVSLRYYLNSAVIGEWQRVYVPLEAFRTDTDYVDELVFTSDRDLGLYLDDVMMGVGSVITKVRTVTEPDLYTHEVGERSVQTKEVLPSLRAKPAKEIVPSIRVSPINEKFPSPNNL